VTAFVEYIWPADYRSVPVDHGYLLYSALSHALPSVHEGSWQVAPLRGQGRKREVRGPGALVIRGPLAPVLPDALSGGRLRIGTREVVLGKGTVAEVKPSPVLVARLVTVKNAMDPESLAPHLELALHNATEHIPPFTIGRRRVMRIAGKAVVGFGVEIRDLSDEDSLAVQAAGIGGRRRMGGGVFMAPKERRGVQGRWFMTPHAVRRMLEHHGASLGLRSFGEARAWMIEDSQRATKAHDSADGAEVWVGRRPRRVRYVLGEADQVGAGILRPVVTVLPGERRT
jgi:CRISPR-associated protein Cas6